jgi:hypothetical protein
MNFKAERVIVILVVVSFVFTSVYVLMLQGIPLTREEAIEISMNTTILREAQERGYNVVVVSDVQTDYWNADFIRSSKEKLLNEFGKLPYEYTKLPDDHGVWRVFWIVPPGLYILHFIDELSGQILYESCLFT